MLALFAKAEIIPYSGVIVLVYSYSAIAQSGLRQFKLALSLLLVLLSLLLLLSFTLSLLLFSLLVSLLLLLLLHLTDHKKQLIALLIGDKLLSVN